MKDFLKERKWIIGLFFIFIVLIFIIFYILFSKETKTGAGTAGISKEEYESIDIGMSIYKVHEIIDKENEWNDDNVYNKSCEELSKEKDNDLWTYVYKYYGEKNGYAIITYQADYTGGHYDTMKVIKKEQHNLK